MSKRQCIIECNGEKYGSHGDGHWHKAKKSGDYWHPDGENSCYDNLCQSAQPEPGNQPSPSDQENTHLQSIEPKEKEQLQASQREKDQLEAEATRKRTAGVAATEIRANKTS